MTGESVGIIGFNTLYDHAERGPTLRDMLPTLHQGEQLADHQGQHVELLTGRATMHEQVPVEQDLPGIRV